MSQLSGKCDLFDTLLMEKHRDKDGNEVKFGDPNVHIYYSDIMECFELFKARTGGKIYQHKKITLQPWFSEKEFEFIKSRCNAFNYTKNIFKKLDKRYACGFKEIITYTFTYFDKHYTLKELNKKGIYIEDEIKFETLLDLMPYLPYLVGFSCGSHIVISDESFVDIEHNKHLEHCWDSDSFYWYRHELAELYREVVLNYFNPTGREVFLDIKDLVPTPTGNYVITIKDKLDNNFAVEYVWNDNIVHPHWTSPKAIGEDVILLDKQDIDGFLKEDIKNKTVRLKYVKKDLNRKLLLK